MPTVRCGREFLGVGKGKYEVSVLREALSAQLDGLRFHGSRSSRWLSPASSHAAIWPGSTVGKARARALTDTCAPPHVARQSRFRQPVREDRPSAEGAPHLATPLPSLVGQRILHKPPPPAAPAGPATRLGAPRPDSTQDVGGSVRHRINTPHLQGFQHAWR